MSLSKLRPLANLQRAGMLPGMQQQVRLQATAAATQEGWLHL